MEKEFVSYEQALALKELGFDDKTLKSYDTSVILVNGKYLLDDWYDVSTVDEVKAPLHQQAFRWFREKFSIQATIEPTKDQYRFELGFNYWIWNTKTGEEWFTEPKDRPAGDYVFDTYEEAELECLKKLIEITKEKK